MHELQVLAVFGLISLVYVGVFFLWEKVGMKNDDE